MTVVDSNAVIRKYLTTASALTNPLIALVGDRIYCPRLPENATLPAVGFFTRGGTSDPYIPDIPSPSVQFDCWADDPIEARSIYNALYDALQGLEYTPVTIGANTHYILSAIEEVQGQDVADNEIPNYFRVITFFQIMVRSA